MARRRVPRWLIGLGVLVLAVVLIVAFWDWDWFIPMVEARASAALGRPVKIAHLHVRLGGVTTITADDVEIADPPGFPPNARFGSIDRLAVGVDILGYVRNRAAIDLPLIAIDHPVFDVATSADGKPNYDIGAKSSGSAGPAIRIGDLRITDGHAHVVIPKLKSNFALDIATHDPAPGEEGQLLVDARGTYAGAPITGRFVGGEVLSLRDKARPYPIDLRLANGDTRLSVVGTVQDPLAFKGTNITVKASGPNMGALYHLTGVPIPETPPFQFSGRLDYAERKIRLTDFNGRLGRSDIEGTLAVDPGAARPQVTADLASRSVDLTDLGGFIGTTPGPAGKGETAEQQREKNAESKSRNLLPDQPLNVPKLEAADVELRYRGARIQGRSIPLDNLAVDLTIRDGKLQVHPVEFGVGPGRIIGNISITPGKANDLAAKVDVDFRQVDVSRLMAATHTFGGEGTIGGRAIIDGSGNSVAQIVGHGNGDLKLFMSGGNLSALLVDLSGLEFGNALISALGLPTRAEVRCMVADLPLREGIVNTNILLLDTTEANIEGSGTINLRNETIDYQLKTTPKHFSIGSLPAPIDIRGPLKSPGILPDPASLAVRGGVAVALGALLTPLAALLPTIQLGLGKDTDCSRTVAEVGEQGHNRLPPAAIRSRLGHDSASGAPSRR